MRTSICDRYGPWLAYFVAINPDNHITWRIYIDRTMIDEHNLSTCAILPGAAWDCLGNGSLNVEDEVLLLV